MGTFTGSGDPRHDPTKGMPVTRNEPLSPMGQIEQLGLLADGSSRELLGWRRVVVVTATTLMVVVSAALILLLVLGALG
jgi:hypothetical protein